MDNFNKAKQEFYRELKNRAACKSIATIRKVYQICFYLSIIAFFFIIGKLNSIKADTYVYISIIVGYVFSYCVLLMLRALEHVINKLFYLEQELLTKGVIDRQEPTDFIDDGNN